MIPVIDILGLMLFTWLVAIYTTTLDEPQLESRVRTEVAKRLGDVTSFTKASRARLPHGFSIRSDCLFSVDSRKCLGDVPTNRTETLSTARDPFVDSLMACAYPETASSSRRLLNFSVPELVRPMTMGSAALAARTCRAPFSLSGMSASRRPRIWPRAALCRPQ